MVGGWPDWWWHKHLHVSPPSTRRLLQTINPNVNRNITFISVAFNGAQQRDLPSLGIYNITKPTFERQETLDCLRSLNAKMINNFVSQSQACQLEEAKCLMARRDTTVQYYLRRHAPRRIDGVSFLKKCCFLTLKGNCENLCNRKLN